MKLRKMVPLGGQFAKLGEDIKDGDIITILDEGKEIEGDYGMRNVFKVRLFRGDERIQSFNGTSTNYLIDAYGDDTLSWVGKEVRAWVVKQMIAGKLKDVVYFTAPTQTLELEN